MPWEQDIQKLRQGLVLGFKITSSIMLESRARKRFQRDLNSTLRGLDLYYLVGHRFSKG